MLMMRPPLPCSIMMRPTNFVARNIAVALMRMKRSHTSSRSSVMATRSRPMIARALLTRMSTCP
jgi:hypothetical protein